MAHLNEGTKIALGVDGSAGNRLAIEWALAESRTWGADLVAVYAWHIPAFAYGAPYFVPIPTEEMVANGQRILQEALVDAGGDPGGVELRVEEGVAHVVLRDLAVEPGVDLVVVGSRGRGTVGNLFLGSTSHALSHHCSKPLVIVPTSKHNEPAGPRANHIVVGTDGSGGADAAVHWAAEEARRTNSLLEVVSAWTWTPPLFLAEADPGAPIHEILKKAAEDVLGKTADRVDLGGLSVKLSALEGSAADVLVERAAQADMLVVGRRGLGPARELVLGSVSHSCTHRSTVPVAVIPA